MLTSSATLEGVNCAFQQLHVSSRHATKLYFAGSLRHGRSVRKHSTLSLHIVQQLTVQSWLMLTLQWHNAALCGGTAPDVEQASDHMTQALVIRQGLFGKESLEAAECHNILAKSYLKLGRSDCLPLPHIIQNRLPCGNICQQRDIRCPGCRTQRSLATWHSAFARVSVLWTICGWQSRSAHGQP